VGGTWGVTIVSHFCCASSLVVGRLPIIIVAVIPMPRSAVTPSLRPMRLVSTAAHSGSGVVAAVVAGFWCHWVLSPLVVAWCLWSFMKNI